MDWLSHTVGALETMGFCGFFISALCPKELKIFVSVIAHRFPNRMLGTVNHTLHFAVGSQK